MGTVGLHLPISELGIFSLSIPAMSLDLAHLQGVPQPQTASPDLWTFLINTLSPLMRVLSLFYLAFFMVLVPLLKCCFPFFLVFSI
jgi:hypothetical protein